MAKARDIPGLHAELSYREAAARTVAVRTQELFDHAEGVLDTSDIERVHDMRVATPAAARRARDLRAVLPAQGAARRPRATSRRWPTRSASAATPTCTWPQLEEFAAAVEEADRPGVEVFAERVRAEQGSGNEALAAALAQIQETDLRGRLGARRERLARARPAAVVRSAAAAGPPPEVAA